MVRDVERSEPVGLTVGAVGVDASCVDDDGDTADDGGSEESEVEGEAEELDCIDVVGATGNDKDDDDADADGDDDDKVDRDDVDDDGDDDSGNNIADGGAAEALSLLPLSWRAFHVASAFAFLLESL